MTKQERLEKEQALLIKMKANDREMKLDGVKYAAGIDEVGRGPLAGPVYAACVVLPDDFDVPGVNDSKKLSEKRRNELDVIIRERAIAYGIGIVDNHEIDRINILNATKHAMKIAVNNANKMLPDGESIGQLLIDAVQLDVDIPQKSIIKGDENSLSIAAASIVAKVARDAFMTEMDELYPGYDFASNKGYGTARHYEGLNEQGITPIHRRSFLKNFKEDEMAGKKVYAVRKGRTPGIFLNWDDCKKSVDGFPGAEYKSFARAEDAAAYISNDSEHTAQSPAKQAGCTAYVDGSYDNANKRYSGAAVILIDGEVVAELSRCCDDEQAELRNVAGEIIGAELAIDYCIEHGIKSVTINHDYMGIGKWGNAEWKANLPMTQGYRDYVKEAGKTVEIDFHKVPAHSGVKYNERADFLAKKALTENV